MQLQLLRKRLQSLPSTEKSLADVLEIVELLYVELNASAILLTKRDMTNFLYICRAALSWGPAAISKVSMVLNLLISTDTYLSTQIISGGVSAPLHSRHIHRTTHSHKKSSLNLANKPCKKYSATHNVRTLKPDKMIRIDSMVAPRNQLGRIFQNPDCVRAMCRLYKRFFEQVTMAARLPREDSIRFFQDVSSCVLAFLKPITFLLLKNPHRLHWFTTFLVSAFSYLSVTDLYGMHDAGLHFFTIISEAIICILSPLRPFSERYIGINFERSSLLSNRTTLSKELMNAINSFVVFREHLIPSHSSSEMEQMDESEPPFYFIIPKKSRDSTSNISYILKFYSLQKDVPIVTSVVSKYSLHHVLFIYNWCSNLLISVMRSKEFATVTEFFLLFRLFEYYSEVPIVALTHFIVIIHPTFFKLTSMDFMQELTIPLSTYLVSLDAFVTQFLKQKSNTPVYAEVLSYIQYNVMLLMHTYSVQMSMWPGSNCIHILHLFHKLPGIVQLLLTNYLTTAENDDVEINIIVNYSLTILQNYVTGIILILQKASPDDLRIFFADMRIGEVINNLLSSLHLFDSPLLLAVASSLGNLIIELVKAIPKIFSDMNLLTELPSSFSQAAAMFEKYSLLIDNFFNNLFLSPTSFFRVTLRYASALSSRKASELTAALNSIKIVQYIFTKPFWNELIEIILTETITLNKIYSLLRIYKGHSYCEEERSALGNVSAHTEAVILIKSIMREDEHGLESYLFELILRPMTLIIRSVAFEPFLSVLVQILYSHLYSHAEMSFSSRVLADDFMQRLLVAFRPSPSEMAALLIYYRNLYDKGLLVAMLRLAQQCIFGDFYINTIPSPVSLVLKRHECTPAKLTESEASLIFDVLVLLLYLMFFSSPVHPVLLRRCIMSLIDYCSDHVILFSHLMAVFATREQFLLNILTELPTLTLAALPPLDTLLQSPDYFKEDEAFQLSHVTLDSNTRGLILQYLRSDLITLLYTITSRVSGEVYIGQTFTFVRSLTKSLQNLSIDKFSALEITMYCYANIPFVSHSARLSSMINFISLAPYSLLSNSLPFRSYVLRILAGEGVSLAGDTVALHKSRNSIQTQNGPDMLIYPYTLAAHHLYYAKIDFSFRKSLSMVLNDHATISVLAEKSITYILVILEHYISNHAIFAEDMALAATMLISNVDEPASNPHLDPSKKNNKLGPVVRARPYRHKLNRLLLPLTRDVHEPNCPELEAYNGILGRYPSFVDFLRRQLQEYPLSYLNLSTMQALPTTSFEFINYTLSAEHPVQYSDMYMSGRHILSPIAFGELALLVKGRLGAYGDQLLNKFWASAPRTLETEMHTKYEGPDIQTYNIYTNVATPVSHGPNTPLMLYKPLYTNEELSKLSSVQLRVSIRRAVYYYVRFFTRQPIFFHQLSERITPDKEYLLSSVQLLLEQAWGLVGLSLYEFFHSPPEVYLALPIDELLRVIDSSKSLSKIQSDAKTISYIASLHYLLLSVVLQSTMFQWYGKGNESCVINGKHLIIYILSTAMVKRNYDVLNVFLMMFFGHGGHSEHVVGDAMRQLMLTILQELVLRLDIIDMPITFEQQNICQYGACFAVLIQACSFLEQAVRQWSGYYLSIFYVCRFLQTLITLTNRANYHYIIRCAIALGLPTLLRELLSIVPSSVLSYELIPVPASLLVLLADILRQAADVAASVPSLLGTLGVIQVHPAVKDRILSNIYDDARSLYLLITQLKQPPTFYTRILFAIFSEHIIPCMLSSCGTGSIVIQSELRKLMMLNETIFFTVSIQYLSNSDVFNLLKMTPYKQTRKHLVHILNLIFDANYSARANLLDLKSQKLYSSLYNSLLEINGHPQQCFSNLCAFVRGMHYDAIFSKELRLEMTERMDTIRLCGLVQRASVLFIFQLISNLSNYITNIDIGVIYDIENLSDFLDFLNALRSYLIETCLRGIAAFADETRYARYFSFFGYQPLSSEQAEEYSYAPPASMDVSYENRQIFYVPIIAVSWITVELKYLYYELVNTAEYIASGLESLKVENINQLMHTTFQPVIEYYKNMAYPSPLFFKFGELLIRYLNYSSLPLISTLLSPDKLGLFSLADEELYTELTNNKLFPYAYLIQYAFLTKFHSPDWAVQACANHPTMVTNILKTCIYSFDKVLHIILSKENIYPNSPEYSGSVSEVVTPSLLTACQHAIDSLQNIDMRNYMYDSSRIKMHHAILHHLCNPPMLAYSRHTPAGILSLLLLYTCTPTASTSATEATQGELSAQCPPLFMSKNCINILYSATASSSQLLPMLCISYCQYLENTVQLFDQTSAFIELHRTMSIEDREHLALHVSFLMKLVCIALYIGTQSVANPQQFVCLSTTSTRFNIASEKSRLHAACQRLVSILPEKLAQFRSIVLSYSNSPTRFSTLKAFYFINPDLYVAQYKLHSAAFLLFSSQQKLELQCLRLDNIYLNTLQTLFPLISHGMDSNFSRHLELIHNLGTAEEFLMVHLSSSIAHLNKTRNFAGIHSLLEGYFFPLLHKGFSQKLLSFESYLAIMRYYRQLLRELEYDFVGLHFNQIIRLVELLIAKAESFKFLLYIVILTLTQSQADFSDALFRLLLCECSPEEVVRLDEMCSDITQICYWYKHGRPCRPSTTMDLSVPGPQYFLAFYLTSFLKVHYSEEVKTGFWHLAIPFLRMLTTTTVQQHHQDVTYYVATLAVLNAYVVMVVAQTPTLRRSRLIFFKRTIAYMDGLRGALSIVSRSRLLNDDEVILLTQSLSELIFTVGSFIIGLDPGIIEDSSGHRDFQGPCSTLEHNEVNGEEVITAASERKKIHLMTLYRHLVPQLAEDSFLETFSASVIGLVHTHYIHVLSLSDCTFTQVSEDVYRALEPYVSTMILIIIKIINLSAKPTQSAQTLYQESSFVMKHIPYNSGEWAQLYAELSTIHKMHAYYRREPPRSHVYNTSGANGRHRRIKKHPRDLVLNHKLLNDLLIKLYSIFSVHNPPPEASHQIYIPHYVYCVLYIPVNSLDVNAEDIQNRMPRPEDVRLNPPTQPRSSDGSVSIIPTYLELPDIAELIFDYIIRSGRLIEYRTLLLNVAYYSKFSINDFLLRETSFIQRLSILLPFNRLLYLDHTLTESIRICRGYVAEECYYYLAKVSGSLFILHGFISALCSEICCIYSTDWELETSSPLYNLNPGSPAFFSLSLATSYSAQNIDRTSTLTSLFTTLRKYVHAYRYYSKILGPLILHLKATYTHSRFTILAPILRFSFLLLRDITSGALVKITMAFRSSNLYNVFFIGYTDIIHALEELVSFMLITLAIDKPSDITRDSRIPGILPLVWRYMQTFLAKLLEHHRRISDAEMDPTISQSFFLTLYNSLYVNLKDVTSSKLTRDSINVLSLSQEYLDIYIRYSNSLSVDPKINRAVVEPKLLVFLAHFNLVSQILKSLEQSSFIILTSTFLFLRILVHFNAFINFTILNFQILKDAIFQKPDGRFVELVAFLIQLLNKNVGYYVGILEPSPTVSFPAIDNEIILLQQGCNHLCQMLSASGYQPDFGFLVINLTYYTSDFSPSFIDSLCKRILRDIAVETVSWHDGDPHISQKDGLFTPTRERLMALANYLKQSDLLLFQGCHSYPFSQKDAETIYLPLREGKYHNISRPDVVPRYILPAAFFYDITSPLPAEIPEDIVYKILFTQISPSQPLNLMRLRNGAFLLLSVLIHLAARPLGDTETFYKQAVMLTSAFTILSDFAAETCHEFLVDLMNSRPPNEHPWTINLDTEKADLERYNCTYHPSLLAERWIRSGVQRLHQKILLYLPALRSLDNFLFSRNSFYRFLLNLLVVLENFPCEPNSINSITESFCRHIPQQSNVFMGGLIRHCSRSPNSFIPVHTEPAIGGVGAGLPHIGNVAGNKYGFGLMWLFYEFLMKQWRAGPPIEYKDMRSQGQRQPSDVSDRKRFYVDFKRNIKMVLELHTIVTDVLSSFPNNHSVLGCNFFQDPVDMSKYFIFSSQLTDSFIGSLTLTHDMDKITHIYLELLAVSIQLYDRILFLPAVYEGINLYRTKIIPEFSHRINPMGLAALENKTKLFTENHFAAYNDAHNVIQKKWDEYLAAVDRLYLLKEKFQSKSALGDASVIEDAKEIVEAERFVLQAHKNYLDTSKSDEQHHVELVRTYNYCIMMYFQIFNMILHEEKQKPQVGIQLALFAEFRDQVLPRNGPAFTLPRTRDYSIGDVNLLRERLYLVITSLMRTLYIDVEHIMGTQKRVFNFAGLHSALSWELLLRRTAQAGIKLLNDKELQLGWMLPLKLIAPPSNNLLGEQYISLNTSNWRLTRINVFRVTSAMHPVNTPTSLFSGKLVYRPNFLYFQKSIGIQELYHKIYSRMSPMDLFSMHFLEFTNQFKEATSVSMSYIKNLTGEKAEDSSEYLLVYLSEMRNLCRGSLRNYLPTLSEGKYNQLFTYWVNETYSNIEQLWPRTVRKDIRRGTNMTKLIPNIHLAVEQNIELLNMPRSIIHYFLNTHGTYVLDYFITALRQIFTPNISSGSETHVPIWEETGSKFKDNLNLIQQRFKRAADMLDHQDKREYLQTQEGNKLVGLFSYLKSILLSPEFTNGMQAHIQGTQTQDKMITGSQFPHINSLSIRSSLFPGPAEELFGINLPVTVLSSSILYYTQDSFSPIKQSQDVNQNFMLYSSPSLDEERTIQPSVLSTFIDDIFLFSSLYPQEAIEFVLKSAVLKRSLCTYRLSESHTTKPLPYFININAADFSHLAPIVGFQIATYVPNAYMPGLQGMAITYQLNEFISGAGKYEHHCNSMLELRTHTLYQAFLADNKASLGAALSNAKYQGLFSCNNKSDPDQSILKSAFSCDAMLTNLTVESQIYLLYFALTNPLDNAAVIRRLLLVIRDTLISERVFLEASNLSLIYQYADLSDIYSTLLQSIHMTRRVCLQLITDSTITQATNTQQSQQFIMKRIIQAYKSLIHLPIVSLLSSFRARYKDVYLAGTRDFSMWATCRLMIIISYTKVFAPPYQYLDNVYDDVKASSQIRGLVKTYAVVLWDYLRNNFSITRPHTLNSTIEHALFLGLPAAARMINKKETSLDGAQKLANDMPFISEIFRCIRGQAFSLINSGIFMQQRAGTQQAPFSSENTKPEGINYTALDELVGHLENAAFKNSSHIRDQKHLLEELRAGLGHLRILAERSEIPFVSMPTENITCALKNLGAGNTSSLTFDMPRYWQASVELFVHHIDLFVCKDLVQVLPRPTGAKLETTRMPAYYPIVDSQLDGLDHTIVSRAWELLVSLFISCLNSVSAVNELNDIELLNSLYDNFSLERAILNKGTAEDNAIIIKRSNAMRRCRKILESRFYESRDRAALTTFNTLLSFILMPPSVFHALLPRSILSTYENIDVFDILSKQSAIQWSLLDGISIYTLVTSIMHIHPHHIAHNCRRIYYSLAFNRYSPRRASSVKLGFLAGLLINVFTDYDRQYPMLLKDGNYTAFPPYYVSPRIFIELTFVLGINISKMKACIVDFCSLQDETRHASTLFSQQLRYWDILLVLLQDRGSYKKHIVYLNSAYQFDLFATLYDIAKTQPLLKEHAPSRLHHRVKHDGLLLWLTLSFLATLPGDAIYETGLEDGELTRNLLALQAIFTEKVTQLIMHSVQSERKRVAYTLLLELIINIESYVRTTRFKDLGACSEGNEVLSTLLNFGFLLFVFAYSIYPINTTLETESIHLLDAFDGISAGPIPWYYSVTQKLHARLTSQHPEKFLNANAVLLENYRPLVIDSFSAKPKLLACIDTLLNAQIQHLVSDTNIVLLEKYIFEYMRYLGDLILQNNRTSTHFWDASLTGLGIFRPTQAIGTSFGCSNVQADATASPFLTDIIGGYFYDDGLLYAENPISSATHVNFDSFSGVLPSPDGSFAMPIYSSRTDRISNGISNSLKEDVLSSLVNISSCCRNLMESVILFISDLPIVKVSMASTSLRSSDTVDYLVFEIPNNYHVLYCLSVLMPYAVPLRMGLYKDVSNIVNEAINASSHVAFWDKYINLTRNMHVYQCKHAACIEKFINSSPESLKYDYRKLFGMRKMASIGIAQRILLHEMFNIPSVRLENSMCDLSTGEIVSFMPLTTPNIFGSTPAFNALSLRFMLMKSIVAGQPALELHRLCANSVFAESQAAAQPRTSIGQSLVHAIGLQVLMSYCPLAISRAVRYTLLDSKSRYPQVVAQNASGSISVQNSTTHISQAWMNEISMQLFVNGLVEGYRELSRASVSKAAMLLTSMTNCLDARIPISRVSLDESDYLHINDVSELTTNDSLAQPALEYVAYCIDAGIESHT